MERTEPRDEILDLGAVTSETRGTAPLGIYDAEQGGYFPYAGLDDEN
ncbi:hypothetical protein DFR49_1328 [Hephaestia caeni]|uniref:Benenodin family lasso peptide n=1 Tax=Hephaestia caeni TaxID=645617 RepID=A0A397PCK6_9SPHN|nr:hypothetical protein [Hephaestia caeni]RIA46772.1 hypothetical protein DFR49_1328 [Hephaestia caeni]